MNTEDEKITADFILASIREPKRKDMSPMSQQKYFQSILSLLDGFHADTKHGCGIYFATNASKELVEEVRTKNPHLVSPWETDAGHFLMQIGLSNPSESLLDWNQLALLRRKLIQNFALRAKGNFTIVFSDIISEPQEGAISSILIPALLRNEDVTHINNVPKKRASEIYFNKIDSRQEVKENVLTFRKR